MSRMFYSHFKSSIRPFAYELQKSIAKKDLRPSAHESQKSTPKKPIRPSAYESQKSVPKKAIRPPAYASQKRAGTKKRPPASSSAPQKRAEPQKRSLALAGSEKRAKTENGMMKRPSPLISVQEEDLVGSVHQSDAAHWKRHGEDPSASTCGRCFYIRNKADFMREHPWLTPRPTFMGGYWRLGCGVCSWRYKSAGFEICRL